MEDQVTDVVLEETTEVELPAGESQFEIDAALQRALDRFKPVKWIRAITEYIADDGSTRRFIDYKKLERNKYAPWGRGELV